MSLLLLLIIILILAGGFPAYNSGALRMNSLFGTILGIIILLLILGALSPYFPHRYW